MFPTHVAYKHTAHARTFVYTHVNLVICIYDRTRSRKFPVFYTHIRTQSSFTVLLTRTSTHSYYSQYYIFAPLHIVLSHNIDTNTYTPSPNL